MKGEKTLAELAQQFDVHPNQITTWRGQFMEGAAECEVDEAVVLAERVRQKIENSVIKYNENTDIKVTISIGCAFRPARSLSTKEFIRAADNALYGAKSAGRNRMVLACSE